MSTVNLNQIQRPLREKYHAYPKTAMVVDHAQTSGLDPDDPFHFSVSPMPKSGVKIPIGVHQALGGLHDAPTPGDLLCAALAACQESTIRMLANLLGIKLEFIEVSVYGNVDVRGTLVVDKQVSVGFQSIDCKVRMKTAAGTSEKLIKRLESAAQKSCVVQQTLMQPPQINTTFNY